MESIDKFHLRWKDFECNISSALHQLRQDTEFVDVTIAVEQDKTIQAHKVILSACSPFFHRILSRYRNETPLIYLKGVNYSDLVKVIQFMYQGQVSVAQSELNSFLKVAEELKVKGLTTQTKEEITHTENQCKPPPSKRCRRNLSVDVAPPPPSVSIKSDPDLEEQNEQDFQDEFDPDQQEKEEAQFGNEENTDQQFNYPIQTEEELPNANKVAVGHDTDSSEVVFKVLDGSAMGTPVWTCGGFTYIKDVEKNGRIYLKCRYMRTCKGRAVLNYATESFQERKAHNCTTVD